MNSICLFFPIFTSRLNLSLNHELCYDSSISQIDEFFERPVQFKEEGIPSLDTG